MTRKQVSDFDELYYYLNNECLSFMSNTQYKNVVLALVGHTYSIVDQLGSRIPDFFKYHRSTDVKSHQPAVYNSLWKPCVTESAKDVRRSIIFLWLADKFKDVLHPEIASHEDMLHPEITSHALSQIQSQASEIREQIQSGQFQTTFEEMCISVESFLTKSPAYAYVWVDMIHQTNMLYVSIGKTSRTGCNPYLIVSHVLHHV